MEKFILKNASQPPTIKTSPGLLVLCLMLWLAALFFGGFGIWALVNGETQPGALGIGAAVLSAGAGAGIFKLRRWGVALFGLLSALGSINHLANIFRRYTDLSNAAPGTIFAALVSITAAILIPAGLFYLTLMLWRKAR